MSSCRSDERNLIEFHMKRNPSLVARARILGWDDDDVVQETRLALLKYPPKGSVSLSTATGNAMRWAVGTGFTYFNFQKRSARPTASNSDADGLTPCTIDRHISIMDARSAIERAVLTLPEKYRQIIRLLYGLDDGICRRNGEVGKLLGVTGARIQQVHADCLERLAKPRLKLREALGGFS